MDVEWPNFTPLASPRSFRLLKLVILQEPSKDAAQGTHLCLLLRNFDLEGCPEYYALSYTWGNALYSSIESIEDEKSEPQEPIYVVLGSAESGQELKPEGTTIDWSAFSISENLRDALAQLAKSGYVDKWLWIDAICIDQRNVVEKGTQVAMMGDIYSNSSQVLVWLGSDASDLEDFLWLNNDFLAGIGLYIQEFGLEDLMQQTPFNQKLLGFLNLKPPCGDWVLCWQNYMSFCRRRRWFSRIWIVQEVALARDVIVLCRESTIPWYNVDTLSRLLRVLGWQPMVGLSAAKAFGRAIGDETIRISVIVDRLQATVNRGSAAEPATLPARSPTTSNSQIQGQGTAGETEFYSSLQKLLLDTRPYSATDSRDKIFGVLGIAQKALPSDMEMPLRPDYSPGSTAQSAFASIATLLLEKLPRLSNLSHVEDKGSRRVAGLPSWVPDYTSTLMPVPLTSIRGENFDFDCCPDDGLPKTQHTIDGSSLSLNGAPFDRVSEVAVPMWDIIKSSDISSCLTLCKGIKQPYLDTNQDAGEVLWRTMIANSHNSEPATDTMSGVFNIWAQNRLAAKMTPEIMVRDATGAITSNVKLDEALLRSQLSSLQALHDASIGKLSLPTVDAVLTSARQMHHFKLQDFVSQGNNILDPNDPFPTAAEQLNRIERNAAAFHTALSPTMPFRRLYLTEKGYLGLGPESTAVGDQVFMLQSARVPFVLRDNADGSFELIGETYVHEFMDGRMAEELKCELGQIHIR
ncbi:heterokaryon incompatibility protein-domain-containing protein [Cadophora sp. MPI-SDFR-AT-0126]|nr:heterokaryon incompatibility protein-domain-containing protein [Leotiomycetes sp. MPI-SDFR-AT-0126]